MENKSNEILEAALEYTKRGWPVFPIWGITEKGNCACMGKESCNDGRNAGKHPVGHLVPNGCLNATTDEKKIRDWFTDKDFLNIGIATGVKSFIAVDIDWIDKDPNKGLAFHDDFSETKTIKSGSGARQLWYAPEEGFRNKQKIRSSVDIRADGGYVVAPPSKHKSGQKYEFVNDLPLNPFPENIKALINNPIQNNEYDYGYLFGQQVNDRHPAIARFTYLISNYVKMGLYSVEEAWNICLARRQEDQIFEEKTEKEWKDAFESALKKRNVSKIITDNLDDLFPIESSLKLGQEELSEAVWLVKNLIPTSSLIEIHGSKGSYKSLISNELAYCLALKVPFLKCDEFEIEEKVNVLIFDQENGRERAKRRIRMFDKFKTENVYFITKRGFILNERTTGWLINKCIKEKIKLVIFDTLIRIHNAKENDATEMAKIFSFMRQLTDSNVSVIFLHHTIKGDGNENQDLSRGSGEIGASPDAVLQIKRNKKDMKEFVMEVIKQRDTEEMSPFIVRQTGKLEDEITFSYIGYADEKKRAAMFEEDKKIKDNILNYINQAKRLCNQTELIKFLTSGGKNKICGQPKALTILEEIVNNGTLKCSPGPNNSKLYGIPPNEWRPQ